jgi:hypothetical protein
MSQQSSHQNQYPSVPYACHNLFGTKFVTLLDVEPENQAVYNHPQAPHSEIRQKQQTNQKNKKNKKL